MNNDIRSLILKYKDNRKIKRKIFIETGTALGETTLWAARHFYKVYSIEFQENNYVSAFQALWNIDNVRIFWGDSANRIKDVIWMVQEPAVYFLDAHYTNGPEDVVANSGNCPIIEELGHILIRPFDNIVFIDDARLFGVEPGWPSIEHISDFCVQNGYVVAVVGDAIVVSRDTLV